MYNELYHHGILGQKWGVRRYQNADGSLTAKGIKRYKARAEKYKARAEKYLDKNANKLNKLKKQYDDDRLTAKGIKRNATNIEIANKMRPKLEKQLGDIKTQNNARTTKIGKSFVNGSAMMSMRMSQLQAHRSSMIGASIATSMSMHGGIHTFMI